AELGGAGSSCPHARLKLKRTALGTKRLERENLRILLPQCAGLCCLSVGPRSGAASLERRLKRPAILSEARPCNTEKSSNNRYIVGTTTSVSRVAKARPKMTATAIG